MSEIVITVQGQSYVVDSQRLLAWLAQNAKVFASANKQFNEVTKLDDQGRTILNG